MPFNPLIWRAASSPVAGSFIAHAMLIGSVNEGDEEGMWGQRLRFEFRVELAAQEPGMIREFDYLDKLSIG